METILVIYGNIHFTFHKQILWFICFLWIDLLKSLEIYLSSEWHPALSERINFAVPLARRTRPAAVPLRTTWRAAVASDIAKKRRYKYAIDLRTTFQTFQTRRKDPNRRCLLALFIGRTLVYKSVLRGIDILWRLKYRYLYQRSGLYRERPVLLYM